MILRSLYGSLYDLWKKGLRDYFLRVCAAFVLLALVFFGAGELFPSLQERLWKLINISMESAGVYTEDGTISAMNIFANNMMACFFVLLYGLVPFLRLGALSLGLNAMSLGTMAVWYVQNGVSLLVLIAGILPHGIIELPVLFLTMAMSFYTCDQLTRRWRKDEQAHSLWGCTVLSMRLYSLVVVPLLAVAAWVESVITPLFLSLLP